MLDDCEVLAIAWRGVEIEVRYWSSYFGGVRAKLEVRSTNPHRAPLPISSTGYQVCYPRCGEIEARGDGVAAQVVAWLDEEAASREWKAHAEKSRQGELF